MIRYGASAAGKVFLNKEGAIANNMFKVELDQERVFIRYIFHYLSLPCIYQMLNGGGGKSTMPSVNFKQVSEIEIPIPPIEEQKRIVEILDRFDILCNDISTGLPAEIEGRQKQYEYYRDKLLTFKRLEV